MIDYPSIFLAVADIEFILSTDVDLERADEHLTVVDSLLEDASGDVELVLRAGRERLVQHIKEHIAALDGDGEEIPALKNALFNLEKT